MKAKTESEFTEWYCQQLRDVGYSIFAIVGNKFAQTGYPDRRVSSLRFCGALEFKINDREVTGNQKTFIRNLVDHGDSAFVLRYYPSTDSILYYTPDLTLPYGSSSQTVVFQQTIPKKNCGEELSQTLVDLAKKHYQPYWRDLWAKSIYSSNRAKCLY